MDNQSQPQIVPRNLWPEVLFWAFAIASLFVALGNRQLWAAEDRWAEVSRQMIISGDYFHPTINGQPYFDKPLLSYWAITGLAQLTGTLNEWTLRLPSAIAGLIALASVIFLGTRLWDRMTGRLAGWLLLTTYGFLFWARTGQADMENCAAIILAAAWQWSRRDRPGFMTWFVFYLICWTGAQMKGLAALAVPCLVAAPDLLRDRRWRALFTFPHIFALAAASLVYFMPFAFSTATQTGYDANGLLLVFRENIERFYRPFDHQEPFYVYFYYVPRLFLPWVAVLIIGGIAALIGLRQHPPEAPTRRWLEKALLVFLFFTASGSRRAYYILPLLPFCALLCARFLLAFPHAGIRRIILGIQSSVAGIAAAAGLLLSASWPLLQPHVPLELPTRLAQITFVLSAGSLLIWLCYWKRPAWLERSLGLPKMTAAVIASTAVLMGGFFCLQQPLSEGFRHGKAFAQQLQTLKKTPVQLAFYDKPYAAILFYMSAQKPLPVMPTPAEATAFLSAAPGRHVLLLMQRDLELLQSRWPADFKTRVVIAEPSWRPDRKDRRSMLALTRE